MARPTKTAAEKRKHEAVVRMNDAEHQALKAAAAEAGMPLARFLRESALKTRVVNRDDWRKLVYELNRVGNNLNQIAHWANTHKGAAEAAEVVVALLRLERAVRDQAGQQPEAAEAVDAELSP